MLPDAFHVAAAAGDSRRLIAWFGDDGRLRPEAAHDRPDLADVGWPPAAPVGDAPADVIAEGISLAAQLGRSRVCEELLARGADPSRASLLVDFLAEAPLDRKLELTRDEQREGRLVAMTGDVTNDAPALAQAEIGVATKPGPRRARGGQHGRPRLPGDEAHRDRRNRGAAAPESAIISASSSRAI